MPYAHDNELTLIKKQNNVCDPTMKHMQGRMPYKDPEKRKEYYKQRYQQNKDRWKIYYKHRNKDSLREYHMAYFERNRERILANRKKYYQTHRDDLLAKKKEYSKIHHVELQVYQKQYRKANPDKYKKYQQTFYQRHARDPVFRLHKNIRLSIRNSLNNRGGKKSQQTHQYLGCSFHWFVNIYWPSKIAEWNTQYPDHPLTMDDCVIDHIKPLAWHDEDEIKAAWHFSNLQPLPANINNLKSDRWTWDDERHFQCNILYKENQRSPYLPVDMPLESNWPKQEISLPVQPTQNASILGQIPAPVPSFHS